MNPVLQLLRGGHHDVQLAPDDWSRLATWMDTLGQRSGSFSRAQEAELVELRQRLVGMLEPPAQGP